MWSNGNIPFSGGTGRSPLLPPNAPPVLHRRVKAIINNQKHQNRTKHGEEISIGIANGIGFRNNRGSIRF